MRGRVGAASSRDLVAAELPTGHRGWKPLLRRLGLAMLTVALPSCAMWQPIQQDGSFHDASMGASFELPEHWVIFNAGPFGVLFSKDGPNLSAVRFSRAGHRYAFPAATERDQQPPELDTPPMRLAEMAIAENHLYTPMDTMEVLDSRPATLGGMPAFRLHLAQRSEEGLRQEKVIYGAITEDGYFELEFLATTLVYFERDLPGFERMVASFRFVGEQAPVVSETR